MPKFTAAASHAYIPSSTLNTVLTASPQPITPATSSTTHRTTADTRSSLSPRLQLEALGCSKRKHIPTKRALAGHIPDVAKSKQRSRAYRRTQELKKPQLLLHSRGLQSHLELDDNSIDSETEVPARAEQEAQQVSTRQHFESQLNRKFRQFLQDSETQDLEGILDDLSNHSTHPIQTEEPNPEVRVLSPIPVAVGGGFHLDHPSMNCNDMNTLEPPTPISRHCATHRMPSRPLEDISSPFIAQANTLHHPTAGAAEAIDEHMSEGDDTELEPNEQPTEGGVPTSSQSLGVWVSDPPGSVRPSAPRSNSAQSHHSDQPQVENQDRAPTSPSLGQDKAPVLPPRSNIRVGTVAHTSRSSRYRTRLNIVSINSSRQPTQTIRINPTPQAQEPTRNDTMPRHSSQPTSAPRMDPATQSLPQQQSARGESVQASSQQLGPTPALDTRTSTDLLEDDEEEHAILHALATFTIAPSKKRKPAMSDLDGTKRHIVLVVRDLVLVCSLQAGTFQTRGVYRQWFEESYSQVYHLVYEDDIVPASDDMRTVTLNSMSTCRGHINEHEREVVHRFYKLTGPTTEDHRKANIDTYLMLWPNAFLCKHPSTETGHYESDVIGQGITAGYFHGPTAIGVRYPKYFMSMDYPLVAFILCLLQCCIGEWQSGYFEKKPLSARYMLSLYVCHLQGLKEAEVAAPERMKELREKWYNDSLSSSGALREPKRKEFVQPTTRREDVRPDSPHRRQRPVPRNATPGPGPTSVSHRASRFSPFPPRLPTTPSPRAHVRGSLSQDSTGRLRLQSKGKGRAI